MLTLYCALPLIAAAGTPGTAGPGSAADPGARPGATVSAPTAPTIPASRTARRRRLSAL
ncbi:hypothetical protein [Streptomyces sp. NPDC003077]|uniref:hypothetical protein n=1 Tax=Streptomyces sp. NPDC003077 TaxID=3154443 RepID=UPI0033B4BFEA